MTTFNDEDLTEAQFRECDLTRARFVGVVMQDVEIDGLIRNVVISGVEVTALIEAELDRRHPVRLLMRSSAPADLREAHRQLQAQWTTTVDRLHGMPAGTEHRSVNDEWSTTQTLRHLVIVHDSWFGRCCLGSTAPFTSLGLGPDFVPDQEVQGLDPNATPDLAEVLAVRAAQGAELAQWVESVTGDELSSRDPVPQGPGWAPYTAGSRSWSASELC